MRIVLWIVGGVALVWSAYWLWTAQARSSDISDWLADRREDGWQAEVAEIAVTGYPLRFDTVLRDIALADPETGLAWQAPRFDVSQVLWQPTSFTATWPGTSVIRTPTDSLTVANDALVAEVITRPLPSAPLVSADLRADTMTFEASNGDTTSLADFSARIDHVEGTTYDMQVLAQGLVLSAPLLRDLGRELPQSLERAQIDLQASFDRRWDLGALEEARPQPTRLDLRLFEAAWGPMALRLTAEMDIDAKGIPEGTLAVQAQNWRDMLEIAVRTGTLPSGLGQSIGDALGLLAGFSGNPQSLDIELRFIDGRTYLGPLAIGPAPRIRLR